MEGADEERKSSQYSSEAKVRCVLNRGLRLGRQILLAGFLASSAPVVLPPLVVVSAIGISVSVPYGLFLASHACTEKFMSILLPMPTPPPLLLNSDVEGEERQDRKEVCLEEYKEEQLLMQEKETRRGIEVVDVSEEDHNMAPWNDDEQGVVQKDEPELLQDATDVIEDHGSGSEEDYSEEEKASPEELLMGGQCHGVVITVEGLEKIGDEIEEYEAPFEVTNVDFEELGDEGDITEAELEKETKGVLEKIRDEGKSDTTKEEYVNGIRGVNMEMRESGDEKSRDPEEYSNATAPVELADSYVQHSSTQSEYSLVIMRSC